tara:strand:+ start:8378 stop:8842 length:465 start_codon:yes stop_codon:yes gene_type:complete
MTRKYALAVKDAAVVVIDRVARGIRIDHACKNVGDFGGFTKLKFRAALRKHPDLFDAYRQAREDYVREQADEVIALADELEFATDALQVRAMEARIKARQWAAERLLDDYQPKTKTEHSGATSLQVITGVPRTSEQVKDAEHRVLPADSIEDIL